MTEAELKLWSRLRNARLDGYKFRRQAPLGPYVLDFFCESEKAGGRGGRRPARRQQGRRAEDGVAGGAQMPGREVLES
jgi:hypothetical protein